MKSKHTFLFNKLAFVHFLYLLIVAGTGLIALVFDIFIFSQAVRTALTRVWKHDDITIVIGTA